MKFEALCRPTMIGSMPHTDPGKACQVVLENLTEIPAWPQLPKISFKENMYVQYTEGMPAVTVDDEKEHIEFDTSKDLIGQIEKFYERFLAEDMDCFAVSQNYSRGLHTLLGQLKKLGSEGLLLMKGQVTGPISFGLTVTDEKGKAIFYHEMLSDVIVKCLGMKVKWQEKKFKEAVPKANTLIFFDEPYLTSFGSAYINVSRDDVIRTLSEAMSYAEGLIGVHCCGKTDWTLFTECNFDLISFDAYDYTESLALYPKEIKAFLEKGGILAWGIVPSSFPTTEQIAEEDVNSLVSRLEDKMQLLVDRGIDKEVLLRSAIITPNCGTASLPVELAEKALMLTRAVSDRVREKL